MFQRQVLARSLQEITVQNMADNTLNLTSPKLMVSALLSRNGLAQKIYIGWLKKQTDQLIGGKHPMIYQDAAPQL